MVGDRHPWVRAGLSLAAFVGSVAGLAVLQGPVWVQALVQAGFTAWFVFLVQRAVGQAVRSTAPGVKVFRQAAWYLAVGLVGTLGFGALTFLAAGPSPDPVPFWVLALAAGLSLLSFGLVLDWCWGRHWFTEGGFSHGSPWGPRTEVKWDEVKRVRFWSFVQGWRLERTSGRALWLWPTFLGTPEFFERLVERVPAEAFDPASLGAARDLVPQRPSAP